ncbi:MAG: nitrilase-related carbon-nitrogen hydrolase [Arcobacteraceae bacterium]
MFKPTQVSFIFLIIMTILILSTSISDGTAESKGQLVAVQMKLNIEDFYSQQDFTKKIENLMEEVATKTNSDLPALVVFPEDIGLMLIAQKNKETLSTVHTIEEAIKKMTMKHLLPLAWYRIRYNLSWVPALYYYYNKEIARTYFDTFSNLAKKYRMYIVAGSVPLPHYEISQGEVFYQEGPLSPEIYNTSYLFDPAGRVVGYQDKVHLLELEQEGGLHLTAGNIEDIKVFDTTLGKTGIAVCLDSFKEDVINRLREQDAEILIQPSANPVLWEKWQQEEWLESSYKFTRELQYFKYAINPMMNGEFFDLSFYGQSSIISRENNDNLKNYFDLEPQNGFLVISESADREEILVAEIVLP